MRNDTRPWLAWAILGGACCCGWLAARTSSAQGIGLNGVGPINRSMAGAATAAPIDAAGAIFWNPASISGLASNEMTFGVEMLLVHEELTSFVPGFGGDSTRGEPGASAIPMMAWSHHVADSDWTVGLGVFGVGGFQVNYPSSLTNPLLTPPPPVGGGLGALAAQLEILQVAPTISLAVTDRLSIGVAPILGLARLGVDPLILAAPDDANGDGIYHYREGLGNRYHYGGGFQAGAYYLLNDQVRLGGTIKTPTWFEDFRFRTVDELGLPRVDKVDIDYPLTISVGGSYLASEKLLVACDVRHLDYRNTAGFRTAAFQPDGSLSGLGWTSTMAVSLGAQYLLSDGITWRGGYGYQENPIRGGQAAYNVLSPLIVQHLVSCGASIKLAPNVDLNATYIHGFEARTQGPIVTPAGPIPGALVSYAVAADALAVGISVRY